MVKLENYTVVELKERAKKRGLVGYSKLRKTDLISLLRSGKKGKKSCVKGRSRSRKSGRCRSRRKSKRTSRKRKRCTCKRSVKRCKYTVYTKVGCGYCRKAKALLRKYGFKYNEIKLTDKNKDEIYAKIDKKTKDYRYFPIIFCNNRFIGGYTELEKKMIK